MNRKSLICFLLFTLLLCCFSCGESTPIDTEEAKAPATEINAEYKILYEPKYYTHASSIRKTIKELTGSSLEMTSDKDEAQSTHEILIGNTGRAESDAFISELADFEYGVKVVKEDGKVKIVIAGKKADYTADAVSIFLTDYMPTDSSSLALKTTETTKKENTEDKNKDTIMKAQPIQWEDDSQFSLNGGYARLLDMPDGRLAMAYSSGNAIMFSISSDDGKTWTESYKVAQISQTPLGQPASNANANAVVMANGDIMVAFRCHTPSNTAYTQFYSSIRFCISSDGGKTWSADKTVVENTYNGSKGTGFWEPHMIYVKDGRLAMYYANDCLGGDAKDYPFVKDSIYQHIIVHLYDEATGSFGAPIIASNGEVHNSRDGMPVVCKLSDGSYAMVIESSAYRSNYPFVIQILFSEDGIVWSEPKTVFSPSGNGHYAGAPYITCLEDGRIVISCQATEGSGSTLSSTIHNNSAMNVIISEKPITYADRDTITQKSFKKIFFNPFTSETENSFSIWPAMSVHNGKLYCVAQCGHNTSATSAKSMGLYIRIGNIKK